MSSSSRQGLLQNQKRAISILCGKKVLYTQHNPRELNSLSTQRIIRASYRTIFVYEPINLPDNGIYLPAYIPADDHSELAIELENKLRHFEKIIVSVSSFSGKSDTMQDLYGFDIILEAINNINLPYNCALVLVDSNGKLEKNYRIKIDRIKKDRGVNIFYINYDINFQKLLSISDIFIRATRTDGDALSVREALNNGNTVLASDCVMRPAGCFDSSSFC